METTDTTHILVVALEVMKISIIVTVTTVAQSLAATAMIDGTVVEDDTTKSNVHCITMSKNKSYIANTNDNTLKKSMRYIGTNLKWCSLEYC
jgi:hypothetical protein